MKSLKPGHHIAKVLLFRTHHLWNSTTELILIGIGDWNQGLILVSVSNWISCFSSSVGYSFCFEKVEIEYRLTWIIYKYLIIGSTWQGPFYSKEYPKLLVTKFLLLKCGFGLLWKYLISSCMVKWNQRHHFTIVDYYILQFDEFFSSFDLQ